MDLLRHLSYLVTGGADSTVVGPETRLIQYNAPPLRWCLERGKVEGLLSPIGAGQVPAHVAVLTDGSQYGSWLLLDLDTGECFNFFFFFFFSVA